ncbi:MAG: hypothetical protein E2O85_01980 [Bacteroidetes bacterium]|nr:MAG: hypothetical protein E2O85_01980 [Bacteroidota bacterium]
MLVGPADPVSFSQDVLPLLTSSCAGSGCHIGESTSGVNLSSYSHVTLSQGIQYDREIVVASDASASPLVDKVKFQQPQFGSRMPQGRSPLSHADIVLIESWINDGAENN